MVQTRDRPRPTRRPATPGKRQRNIYRQNAAVCCESGGLLFGLFVLRIV